jgi:hypothetical protein
MSDKPAFQHPANLRAEARFQLAKREDSAVHLPPAPSLQPLLIEIAKELLVGSRNGQTSKTVPSFPLYTETVADISGMGITDAVKATVMSFDLNRRFTNTEVAKILAEHSFEFGSQNPSVAVSGVLRRLLMAGLIRKVGNRGKAFLFRRVVDSEKQQGAEPEAV